MLEFNDYKDCLLNNKIILKSQQRFKSEAHNVYTEEINQIALSCNDDKRLQTYDRTHIISFWNKCWESTQNRVIKQSKYKMINFDNNTNENKTEHNSNWPYIPDHPYRILIVGGSGSGKTNSLLNLISNLPDIDKIYLYAKDTYEAKYQNLINKREKVGLDHFNDPKAFIEYSNDMQDVYKNIEEYNLGKKRNLSIVFDDMIADLINNKKLNPEVTKLFIRVRKMQFFNFLCYSIIL